MWSSSDLITQNCKKKPKKNKKNLRYYHKHVCYTYGLSFDIL